jgi:hypothetical protein
MTFSILGLGVVFSFSHELRVAKETPILEASLVWVRPSIFWIIWSFWRVVITLYYTAILANFINFVKLRKLYKVIKKGTMKFHSLLVASDYPKRQYSKSENSDKRAESRDLMNCRLSSGGSGGRLLPKIVIPKISM